MSKWLPLFALTGCAPVPVQGEDPPLYLCEGCSKTCEYENLPTSDNSHIEGVVYDDPPPAGGDHNGCWAPWGVHDTEVADENWVHNLEHGGVVFLYNCPDGCDDQVASLTKLVQVLPEGTAMLTPYAALPTKYGMVSWAWRLTTDCWDPERFEDFYDAHYDNAPESITSAPSAGCM